MFVKDFHVSTDKTAGQIPMRQQSEWAYDGSRYPLALQ